MPCSPSINTLIRQTNVPVRTAGPARWTVTAGCSSGSCSGLEGGVFVPPLPLMQTEPSLGSQRKRVAFSIYSLA